MVHRYADSRGRCLHKLVMLLSSILVRPELAHSQRELTTITVNNVHVTVFLVSLKAGGVALNLTEASRVYLMDSWWNPAVEYRKFCPAAVTPMLLVNVVTQRPWTAFTVSASTVQSRRSSSLSRIASRAVSSNCRRRRLLW